MMVNDAVLATPPVGARTSGRRSPRSIRRSSRPTESGLSGRHLGGGAQPARADARPL